MNSENTSSITPTPEPQVDTALKTYLSTFLTKINLETQTYDNLTLDYTNTELNDVKSLTAFQNKLPAYIKTFKDLLTFYQEAPPKTAPQDLLDAVSLIRNGTGKIVTGLDTINRAITERSADDMVVGEDLVNNGNGFYNQGIAKYNSYIDSLGRATR